MTEREEKWKAEQDPDGYWTVWSNNGAVADFCTEENAKLFAAAPALYEALKWAVSILDQLEEAKIVYFDPHTPDHIRAIVKARAALYQARGETGEEG